VQRIGEALFNVEHAKTFRLSGAGTFFEQGEGIKYKFRFALKLLSICINQKFSMEIRSCTFSSHLN